MRSHVLALALALPAAAGCSATVSGSGAGDAEPRLLTSAVVVVERMVDAAGSSHAEASARFVRVAAPTSTEEALRAIGATLTLPPAGQCVPFASLSAGSPVGEPAPVVELVDVGFVSVDADGRQTRLVSRLLPDVTDVVSGVVYAKTADPGLLPSAGLYTLRVGGRADVPAFEVSAQAPPDPADVSLDATDPDGTLVVNQPSIRFSWPPSVDGDLVYVDVQPGALRCTLAGRVATDPALIQASLPTAALGDSGTLTIHRLRSEPLVSQGIEGGELRFDFGRSLAYVRRQ
jgi:hypothetical protein